MRTIRVENEYGCLRTAIVHDGSNAVDITMDDWRKLLAPEDLAAHPETGAASRADVIEQMAGFRAVLSGHGVTLLAPEPQSGAIGQIFTRDPCFVVGERLFSEG